MKEKKVSRANKESKNKIIPLKTLLIVILIIIAAFFFFWHQMKFKESSQQADLFKDNHLKQLDISEKQPSSQNAMEKELATPPATPEATGQSRLSGSSSSTESSNDATDSNPPPSLRSTSPSRQQPGRVINDTADNDNNIAEAMGQGVEESNAPSPLLQARCDKAASVIKNFYSRLDSRPYMKKYDIEQGSETYFTNLIEKLLDTPPVVSGETDDLFTILQNTAHFFRILGKGNIVLLKEILNNEREQFEPILENYYIVAHTPGCSKTAFNLDIPQSALYNYAGFFLNTMGGRLYLFRRDSRSRMVVSYYAILLIDRANTQGYNKHGIEIITAIDLLIDEMESTKNSLQYKEKYLDTLYTLNEKYQ